ncbi:uncharacterized protein [Neodiprion pinetum]|uniref:uncharacterized protein n=1 Tax=Neodiprion pinetum TaxID=441929 RepID=UPI001EE0AE5D|nr:uncharacterized protein LOC124210979 [Neodiprion pinetum]XP_046465481.1 uncharacterized protein LOC124210979 [Neodiprion pinetum]XP_046465482.1 uncharacterized protein LOC124210979 [Neodiprion pinetum]XP_046465483.1 uncharacterized protein LOC124210979 [Neodiprion pinetum]
MTSDMRAQQPLRGASLPTGDVVDSVNGDGGQFVPRSRPVSFYDNFKDVPVMPPCVSSAVSAGNLNQVVRDDGSLLPMSRNSRVSSAVSAGNVTRIQSPKVIGAVSTGHIGKIFRLEKEKGDPQLGRAPSMATCLSTTVPVNLTTSQIAGRHTPTRNSLRHSRMIVMNRTGNAPRKSSQPTLLVHRVLARCLAAVQLILGMAVTSLALWFLVWAPNLPITDIPYWSGIPLLLSGCFGSLLLCCFRNEYTGSSHGFCISSAKVLSVFLSGLATLAGIVACVSSSMHLARLARTDCTPRDLNETCSCRPRGDFTVVPEPILRYVDLSCPEVESILAILLIFSATCNGLGAIIAGWYCYLHWSTTDSRDNRNKYTQVRTGPAPGRILNRPIYNPNLNGR